MADAPPDLNPSLPDWEAFYRDYRKPGYVAGFEITTKLGGGAFGLVFRARKESIGKDYAIKFLQVEDSEVRQAVLHELEQVKYFAQVDHPNLVQIEDRGEVDGIPFLVMQFAGSETLRERLPTDGPPTAEQRDELLRYFLQACRGVAALHERSLVHFDLKPANVFIKGPVARVGDYGLSKLVTHSRGSLTMGRGTPYYMSPEMLQRRGDQRSDVYSLGVMLYELLCGKLPFTGDSEWEVLRKHEKDEPDWPAHLADTEKAVLSRCLQKDPAARFQSVHDLITALGAPAGVAAAAWDDVRAGVGTDMPPPPPPSSSRSETAADDGEDPYAGFRAASREAYKHARKIAREAMTNAREVSQKASAKARDFMQKKMREQREQQRAQWAQWRQKRAHKRAERKAARAAAGGGRGGSGWVWAAVVGPIAGLATIAFLYLSLGTNRVHYADGGTVASAHAARGPRASSWITYPGVTPAGVHFLFDQWSVPDYLVKDVAVTEPEWVSTFRRDKTNASRQLDRHWQRLRGKAPYKPRTRDRTRDLPKFHLFSPQPEHVADIERLLQAPKYDREIAQRLAGGAPQSLAAVATRLGEIPYRNRTDLERAKRLHQLLVEATRFDAIEIEDNKRLSLSKIRKRNEQLAAVWQWFLHEVALTDQTWETFQRLYKQR